MEETEKKKCEHCGNSAIGYQGFGCCAEYVCKDHADTMLLGLKPGEKVIAAEYYLERFPETGS
ncbi:MAG: hypothetical protein A4E35_00709 [Methanoregula sp. PtaU1.Bin051]|nr:MAG: hypothetical protein A4E35_00709 [Methanoregula sp. PtaU1.Bin051]